MGGAAAAGEPPALAGRKPDAVGPARSVGAAVRDPAVFDPGDPAVKNEIVQVIVQYLQDEGYVASSLIVQDEANVKLKNTSNKRSALRRIRRAIMNAEWADVESILAQKATTFRHQNHFLYGVYRQQYLELIDSQQPQKALFLLTKKLKPLERFARSKTDFRDLAYLITCQSVTECDQFADWDGANASRAALVDQCARLLDFETFQSDPSSAPATPVRGLSGTLSAAGVRAAGSGIPPARLVALIRQAIAFQIDSSMYELRAPPHIGTILEDFECAVVPNVRHHAFAGHRGNVKCVTFVGAEGRAIATGSSDNTGRVWGSASGEALGTLTGHRSRIWDVSANASGSLLATAGADGTVRLWNSGRLLDEASWSPSSASESAAAPVSPRPTSSVVDGAPSSALSTADPAAASTAIVPLSTMSDDGGADVYAVRFQPHGQMLVAGGYDSDVRLYDTETQRLVHTFTGHESAVSCIAFNARGTVAITGSKDATVRYWDVLSGLCITTISSHLGEVSSVNTNAAGTLMLTSSKDNSNRLWDMRQCRPIRRFKGHQNTSKNFLRASFGPMERLVVGGSEDGFVYMWDADTEDVVGRLGPANGPVYAAEWNARRSLLVSCSDDGLASTWCYEPPAG
jgi:COMPASS component SWD3